MDNSMRVLVTGVSGFLASHIVLQLLEAGYTVRGTARGPKVDLALSAFAAYPRFEIVEIQDVATGDFSSAFQGVDALIHTTAPLPGHASPEVTLKTAVDGTINVLRQAVEAGVYKVVLTSSIGSVIDPDFKQAFEGVRISEKDWGKATATDVLQSHREPGWVYFASKTIAEEEAWKFAELHPKLDLSAILIAFLIGPTVPLLDPANATALGTNGLLYALISGEPGRELPHQGVPWICDVRDAARAHVNALQLPPRQDINAELQARRVIVYSVVLTVKEITEHLAKKRPDVKARLPSTEKEISWPGPVSAMDNTRMKELLGMKECIPWEKSVDDTVDVLLSLEKTWE